MGLESVGLTLCSAMVVRSGALFTTSRNSQARRTRCGWYCFGRTNFRSPNMGVANYVDVPFAHSTAILISLDSIHSHPLYGFSAAQLTIILWPTFSSQ